MEEVPSNQDDPELRHFLGSITGAMIEDRGEHFARSSSPETEWVPMVPRRPLNLQAPLHDMEIVGSNLLGLENAGLINAHLLTSAFENMNLGLTDGPADYAANAYSFAFRDGHCPGSLVNPSAVGARNGSLLSAFTQTDDFAQSPYNAEHMKPTFGNQIALVYTGMDGSDNAYVTSINLPPALPFPQQHFINGLSQQYAQHQKVDSEFRWHDIDSERHSIMKAYYSYQPMPHVATSDVRWIDSSQCGAVSSSINVSPHLRMPINSADIYWDGAMDPNGNNQMNPTPVDNDPYMIYPDCSCDTCEYCQVQLSEKLKHPYGLRRSPNDLLQNHMLDKVKLKSTPENILMNSEGLISIVRENILHNRIRSWVQINRV